MDLYLHVGTNKTGSSFLQTVLTQKNDELISKGVYVPPSRWDSRMLKGKISPGNGHQLAKYLAAEDESLTTKYLIEIAEQTQNKNLNKVILSNEILIRLFSNQKILNILCNTSEKAGFKDIHVLCFLRNPYHHALSLFKHRGKSGKWNDYDEWLNKNYETLQLFDSFLSVYQRFNIKWNFRLYRKDSDYMINFLFSDFLDLKPPGYEKIQKVNTSLSLNQIAIMHYFESLYPGIHSNLYDNLSEISPSYEHEKSLENKFYAAFKAYLGKYNTVVKKLSDQLPEAERGDFLSKPEIDESLDESYFVMDSKEQAAVQEAVKQYKKTYAARKMRNIYRKLMQIKHKFWSDYSFNSERYGGSLRR